MARPDDGTVIGGTERAVEKHELSEGELIALRDEARDRMLFAAGERLRWYHPERCEGTPDEARARMSEELIAAAEVYGALRNKELAFSEAKGLPELAESVEVEFTEKALAWAKNLRGEIRRMLNDARGGPEVCLDSTPREAFLLFVLDGICGEGG